MTESAPRDLPELLEASRVREKTQAQFYRALAARAVAEGDADATERLNDLHADEQHHLSRLTARLLELGRAPLELTTASSPVPSLDAWETEARAREVAEVAWYEAATALPLDPETEAVLREILASERHHAAELRGKWMSA